jgi:hypothetical protein
MGQKINLAMKLKVFPMKTRNAVFSELLFVDTEIDSIVFKGVG